MIDFLHTIYKKFKNYAAKKSKFQRSLVGLQQMYKKQYIKLSLSGTLIILKLRTPSKFSPRIQIALRLSFLWSLIEVLDFSLVKNFVVRIGSSSLGEAFLKERLMFRNLGG